MELKTILKILLFVFIANNTINAQKALPDVTIKTISGEDFDIKSLEEKENPIILNFWATWCGPCLKELDAIREVYIDWQDETEVEMYAVSVDDARTAKRVKPMVNGKSWEYEILLDENQDLKRAMNIVNVPHVFILYKGKIVYEKAGYVPGAEDKLYEIIKGL